MKILLFRPRPDPETIGLQHIMVCEPLELEYLCAGVADRGHDTIIIDMILEKKPIEHFIKIHQPDIVAITSYITHVNIVKGYCRIIKSLCPRCRIIVGGVHAEVVPKDFDDESIDFIVSANGLSTFKQIVKHIEEGIGTDRVNNELSTSSGEFIKERSFDYPFPDRSKVQRYRSRYYYL